jgi:Cys-tRNA(Pro)/Cys-tRNA(Cys) deacylase
VTTPGVVLLVDHDIPHEILTYEHRVKGACYAARALDLPAATVLKSLVFTADDGSALFALMGGGGRVSEKKLARASGHKRVAPATPRDAQRLTGYQIGGISPLGAKTPLPVFLDATSSQPRSVVINAGARGTLVRLATADLVTLTAATIADLRVE